MRTAGVQTWNQVKSEAKIHACQRIFTRPVGFCRENYLNWRLQIYKIFYNQPKPSDHTRVMLPLDFGT